MNMVYTTEKDHKKITTIPKWHEMLCYIIVAGWKNVYTTKIPKTQKCQDDIQFNITLQ